MRDGSCYSLGMLISVKGEIADELWAAADVVGCEMIWRGNDEQRVSVRVLGHVVTSDLVWDSYEDLVAKLRAIKMDAYMKAWK